MNESAMIPLHYWGISAIQSIQHTCQNFKDVMLVLSHVGDPRFAFTFYFPVAFFLHTSVGKRVLWVAAISEWLNAMAKWMLHGERPYWWVHEPGLYKEGQVPHLQQFDITCETGPGSPSGHAMITSAVLYILLSDFLYYKNIKSFSIRVLCWLLYLGIMCSIAVSRLFIATHFPHQVIAGIITGILIGNVFNSLSMTTLRLQHYVVTCICLTAITAAVYTLINSLGTDPQWSLAKAVKWCDHQEWVHLDTTIFYSLIRDIASLFGLGLGLWIRPDSGQRSISMTLRSLQVAVAVVVSFLSEGYKPGRQYLLLFYVLGCVKHVVTTCFVVVVVPYIISPGRFKEV